MMHARNLAVSSEKKGTESGKARVIDEQGFRPNVGIVISNKEGRVLWGRRVKGRDSWQFPQGGIDADESAEEAMFRELREEVGLLPEHVTVLAQTKGWHKYRLPAKYVRKHESPMCIGQKQKWFLLRLEAGDDAVRLDLDDTPEFDHWRWVSYWHPVAAVVDFKRDVYRAALSELLAAEQPRRARRRGGRRRR